MQRLITGVCFGVAILCGAAAVAARADASGAAPATGARQEPADTPPTSVLDGVFTAEQAASGQEVFQKVCASCHTLAEHTGRKFQAKWSDATIGDMFDLVSSTMPDGNPGSLQPSEYASVIAYFLKETGYPQGKQPLPSESGALMKIRIEPLPAK